MLYSIKPVAMDQKSAAMIIVKFLRTAVYWSRVIREADMWDEDTDLCESCGIEVPCGFNYCHDCDHSGPCQTCGREVQFSDWAWTGHCSRACAREREMRF